MKKFLSEIKDNHIIPLQSHLRDNSDTGIEEQISELEEQVTYLKGRYLVSTSDNKKATIRHQIHRMIREANDLYIKKLNTEHEAQYHQHGIDSNTVFEHVIPLNQLMASYFQNNLTFSELIRMPTCRITKKENKKLNSKAKDRNTNLQFPFRRYIGIVEHVIRKDGFQIDMFNYSIQDHINYFISKGQVV